MVHPACSCPIEWHICRVKSSVLNSSSFFTYLIYFALAFYFFQREQDYYQRIVRLYYQRWLLWNTFRLFVTIKIMVPLEIFNFLGLLIEEASLWGVVVSVSIVEFWLREQGNILWRTSVPFRRNILAIALLMLVSCRTCDISFIRVTLLLGIWNLLFSVKLFYTSQVFSTLEATTSVFLLIFFK